MCGSYDVPLSTALAILALAALGHHDRTLRLAQLRLLEFMQPDGGGSLAQLAVRTSEDSTYQVLVQREPCPDRYPRRVGVPAKRPLF